MGACTCARMPPYMWAIEAKTIDFLFLPYTKEKTKWNYLYEKNCKSNVNLTVTLLPVVWMQLVFQSPNSIKWGIQKECTLVNQTPEINCCFVCLETNACWTWMSQLYHTQLWGFGNSYPPRTEYYSGTCHFSDFLLAHLRSWPLSHSYPANSMEGHRLSLCSLNT